MIQAKIIADSKNSFGNRITTMVVTFPRFILAELNTHRMLSKNSASSRAIPFAKMVKAVQENPFIPIAWQKDHKGMQGTEYITDEAQLKVITDSWLRARYHAVDTAIQLSEEGVTKQLCNRLLEPFMWHTVIITATEWENFFALRCPKYQVPFTWDNETKTFRSRKDVIKYWKNKSDIDSTIGKPQEKTQLEWLKLNKGQAEIHMMELAEQMWDAMNESTPKELQVGEWHIPFGDKIDYSDKYWGTIEVKDENNWTTEVAIKIATARCARVSYTVVGEEGKAPNFEKDLELHDNLSKSGHWSPFEHCAKAMECSMNSMQELEYRNEKGIWSPEGYSGNFRGFIQYRKTFTNENITK